MKQLQKTIAMTILSLCFLSNVIGQVSNYERQPGYWTLGINTGLSYQQADVPIEMKGWGAGLTLGKNIFYQPGALFSVDLRGRALYSQSYGLDHFKSTGIEKNTALNGENGTDYTIDGDGPGFVYTNHRTDMGELALEGVLNFNKLRENTNVDLSIYGGIGLGVYGTRIDQNRGSNVSYEDDYLGIDEKGSVSYKKNLLRNDILDGVYETRADGFENGVRAGIMPSLGFELGYQLTPKFSVGIGHKATFAKTDYLDGQKWNNDNTSTGNNDIHHYTNLNLKFIINEKEKGIDPPKIYIQSPVRNPHTSKDPNEIVRATIKNVESSMNVTCRVNGEEVNFNFNKGKFDRQFWLNPGKNEMIITASNLAGTDQKKVVVFYEEVNVPGYTPPGSGTYTPPPTVRVPVVNITNPSSNYKKVEDAWFDLRATVKNVSTRNDIRLLINGQQKNFDFNRNGGTIRARINLLEGENDILIEAWNQAGKDQDQATIIFEKNQGFRTPPTVDIITPSFNNVTSTTSEMYLNVDIKNIRNRSDIDLVINGRKSTNFKFEFSTLTATISLKEGPNKVYVYAENQAGSDSDVVNMTYRPEVCEIPEPEITNPTIEIVSVSLPVSNPLNPQACKSVIVAKTTQIERKSQLTFIFNGSRNTNFSFDKNTKTFKATVSLSRQNNSIKIIARNEAGQDNDVATAAGCVAEVQVKKPVVDITKPNAGMRTAKPTTTVSANIQNVESKSAITFLLNGRRITDFGYSTATDRLNKNITLKEGQNNITIKATNKAGSDQESISVFYSKPVVHTPKPPQVNITAPTTGKTTKSNVAIQATLKNIKNKRDIELLVNGRAISSFSFNIASQKLSANTTLQKGNNTILVKAKNSDGTDQDSHRITYELPLSPPTVTINSPRNNTTLNKASSTVTATIKNVSNKSEVSFLLNGKASDNFTLRGTSFSAPIKLKVGRNTVAIKVRNKAGADEAQITVNYKAPITLAKPTVVFTSPTKAGQMTRSASFTVRANVRNVSAKNQISFQINGKAYPNFSYDAKTKTVIAKVRLSKGKNNFTITARNKTGSATANSHVVFQETTTGGGTTGPKPKVTIQSASQPTFNPLNPTAARSVVIAKIDNVTSKTQVLLTVNGKKITNFTFNAKTKILQATISLRQGSNTIKIKATTKAGSHEASKVVRL